MNDCTLCRYKNGYPRTNAASFCRPVAQHKGTTIPPPLRRIPQREWNCGETSQRGYIGAWAGVLHSRGLWLYTVFFKDPTYNPLRLGYKSRTKKKLCYNSQHRTLPSLQPSMQPSLRFLLSRFLLSRFWTLSQIISLLVEKFKQLKYGDNKKTHPKNHAQLL